MRISDWSSDVCSSDLLPLYGFDPADLTFDRTRRPPGQNGAFHGIDVAGAAGRKAAKFPVHCLFEPFVELAHFVAVEQRDEPHGLLRHRAKFTCLRIEMVEEPGRSEENPSELQSLMRLSYAVCCLQQINTQGM